VDASGEVSYWRNGVWLYTSGVSATFPLVVDTSLYTAGATLKDVRVAGVAGSGEASLTIGDVTVQEGDDGTTEAVFRLELSDPSDQVVRVEYHSADQTAVLGEDYDPVAGSLSFAPGVTARELQVAVHGDAETESDESFVVALENVTGAALGQGVATGTIVDDDGPPVEAVVWRNLVGVRELEGGVLKKKAATASGWNAGASSEQVIVADGYVELVASETTTRRMLGLSHSDDGVDATDIDYGIELTEDGKLRIRELGRLQRDEAGSRVFGVYATGDRLRIAVESGEVAYYRNGERLYTSTAIPSGPLHVDTSFYTPTATLQEVFVAGR
jgi:hypothetical protein